MDNSELKTLVRKIMENENMELDEMARISTNLTIGDESKLEAAMSLYKGTWVGDMIEAVKDAGEAGISQPELVKKLGKSGQQAINPKVRDLLSTGVLSLGNLSKDKKEKAPSSGVKGRPESDKTKVAKKVNSAFEESIDYEPTEEEIELLGADFIAKLKSRVAGTLKRGRKLGQTNKPKEKDSIAVDIDAENEVPEPLNESFLKMQKLAGVLSESKYTELMKNKQIL